MIKDKRDEFDELFRAKLYDYEPDDVGVDWTEIENQLPGVPRIIRWKKMRYWAAAAAIFLLISSVGVYFFIHPGETTLLALEERPVAGEESALPLKQNDDVRSIAI